MNENNLRNDEMEIDLREIFFVLLKKWWLIAICAVCGAAIAFGMTKMFITPTYQAQSKLYVLNKADTISSFADIQIGSALTKDLQIIAKSNPSIDRARKSILEDYGKEFSRNDILAGLTVAIENDTRILVISVESESAENACIIANAVSEATKKQMQIVTQSDAPTTVESAEVPTSPIGPRVKRNTIIGFLLGAVIVSAVLIVIHLLNDNVKTEEDIERVIGVPTLAVIPLMRGQDNKKNELKEQTEAIKNAKRKKEQQN